MKALKILPVLLASSLAVMLIQPSEIMFKNIKHEGIARMLLRHPQVFIYVLAAIGAYTCYKSVREVIDKISRIIQRIRRIPAEGLQVLYNEQCCICFDWFLRNKLFQPCQNNHPEWVCRGCLTEIRRTGNLCPLCRAELN